MVSLKFCGPKLSAGCTLLSIWGIIQLGLMGLLFRIKSVAFIEDLTLNKTENYYHGIRQVCINLFQDYIDSIVKHGASCYWPTIATVLFLFI